MRFLALKLFLCGVVSLGMVLVNPSSGLAQDRNGRLPDFALSSDRVQRLDPDGQIPARSSTSTPAEEQDKSPSPLVPPKPQEPTPAELFFRGDAKGKPAGLERGPHQAASVKFELKQFGYDFFRTDARFLPDAQAPIGPDYIVGPGDSLRIDIWGNIEGSYHVTVDRNGEIIIPRVGVINLWGQRFAEARETIRRQISKYFSNFEFNVTMGAIRSIQVFIVGEVEAPGTYQVSSLSTVLTALSSAGGPTGNGSLREIRLLRNGQNISTIDFYDFFLTGDKRNDVRLQSGDTIFVPAVGPLVAVAGNVRRPAIYELKNESSLEDVLVLSGGLAPTAYLQKVQVERVQAHDRKIILDLDLKGSDLHQLAGMSTKIQDRDKITVSPISLTGGFVQLKGYVVRPGDYQLFEGMRLADLILPYDNLLPEFFPGLAQVIRMSPPEYRPEILTVALDKALQNDPAHNILLQEYDEVRLFSRKEMQETPEIVVTGAVLVPGSYRLLENMTVKDAVTMAGNVRRRAYLAEAEITRFVPGARETTTERILVNLEKALMGDPEHNLLLHVDDHLFIRSIPDFGDRMIVELKGEVLFPGPYAIYKGETLSSVITRAGGFTNEAYLRGAFFTRETLKEVQRQRLNQLIQEQEQEVLRISSQMAQRAISDEESRAAQEILAGRSALLENLKSVAVQGRMVVKLTALEQFIASDYDIELMDGDVLTVPKNPQTVSVFGQVYNPVSLTYQPGRTVSYYLSQVGGPKKDANRSEMFIVRADGTVHSASQSSLGLRWDRDNSRWTAGGFSSTVLYPGDTVLVPEKIQRIAWLREIRDISTIIFQLALGAAAVASF